MLKKKKPWLLLRGILWLFVFIFRTSILGAMRCGMMRSSLKFRLSLLTGKRREALYQGILAGKPKFNETRYLARMRGKFNLPEEYDIDEETAQFMAGLMIPMEIIGNHGAVLENPFKFKLDRYLSLYLDAEAYGRRKLAIKYFGKIQGVYRLLHEKRVGSAGMVKEWETRLHDMAAARRWMAHYPAAPPDPDPALHYEIGRAMQMNKKWREAADCFAQYLAAFPAGGHAIEAKLQRAVALRALAAKHKRSERAVTDEAEAATLMHEFRTEAQTLREHATGEEREKAGVGIVESYYLEEDYAGVISSAKEVLTDLPEASKAWGQVMFWLGVALESQEPPQDSEAAEAFDSILGGTADVTWDEEHIPTMAAYWRGAVAEKEGDEDQLRIIIDLLKAMPESTTREQALRRFRKAL